MRTTRYGSPSSEQRATRDSSWPGSFFGTHKSKSRPFICATPMRMCVASTRALSAAARLGRSTVQTAFRRSDRAQRRAGRVSSRRLTKPRSSSCPRCLAANPALRIVDLSGAFRFRDARNFCGLVQAHAAGCRNTGRSCLRLAGTLRRRSCRRRGSSPIPAAIRLP